MNIYEYKVYDRSKRKLENCSPAFLENYLYLDPNNMYEVDGTYHFDINELINFILLSTKFSFVPHDIFYYVLTFL